MVVLARFSSSVIISGPLTMLPGSLVTTKSADKRYFSSPEHTCYDVLRVSFCDDCPCASFVVRHYYQLLQHLLLMAGF